MGVNKARVVLLCFIATIVLLACGVKSAGSRENGKQDENVSTGGWREINIVKTITPEPMQHEDFDLEKLAIAGKNDDGMGEDVSGNAEGNAEMPEGDRADDTADGAGSESDAAPSVGSEEDIIGYEQSAEGNANGTDLTEEPEGYVGDTLPELDGSEADNESRPEGSVDEYGLSEDGHSDGHADDSEVESDVCAEQEYADSTGTEYTDDGNADNPVLTPLGTFTATAYCSCSICTGVYSTGYTASGTWATEGRTVACNILPFGTQIYIEGYGYYIVEDTGWSPYGDAWLDIFYSSHDSALAFGVRNVEVYLVN